MNNDRRKAIDALIKQALELERTCDAVREALGKFKDEANELKGDIQNILDEEQEYLDNMSENLKGGDKASVAEQAISSLDEAINACDEADSIEIEFNISEIIGQLEDAKNG